MNTEQVLKALQANRKELEKQAAKRDKMIKKIDAQFKRFMLTICK